MCLTLMSAAQQKHIGSGWWYGTFCYFFPQIGNVIIPTDELIFVRGVGQPNRMASITTSMCCDVENNEPPTRGTHPMD